MRFVSESRNLRARATTIVQPQQLKAIRAAALVSFSFQCTAAFAPASQERRPLAHQHQFEIYTDQGNHCCPLEIYLMVKTSIVCPPLCTRCWCYKCLVARMEKREKTSSMSPGKSRSRCYGQQRYLQAFRSIRSSLEQSHHLQGWKILYQRE